MKNKWIILSIIIVMYLPVSIDATVLHVAVPTLSQELHATNNQLLWIIDIYSLIMAGFLLPMGALGDRIGYKRLALMGSLIFGLASLSAAFATTALSLIVSRALLGAGAAMILPATLSGVRQSFTEEKERNLALGIWVAVGSGGATIGPLVGGFLLEHFYWGSVFLINIPVVIMVLALVMLFVPKQPICYQQPLYIGQALQLTVALLLLIFTLKNLMRPETSLILTALTGVIGFILLARFIYKQLTMAVPMIDIRLLMNKTILLGFVMALFAMIATVGFELVMSQELQFVVGKSPLEAAMFMLPLMIASAICGPIAGTLSAKFSVRRVACLGAILSAAGFWSLSAVHFENDNYLTWIAMSLLGFGASAVFFSATSIIMSAAPAEKATAVGAIEGIAYELGAGLGVAIFGLMLATLYGSFIHLPSELPEAVRREAAASIVQAIQVLPSLSAELGAELMIAAKIAYSFGLNIILKIASVIFLALAVPIWFHKKM